MELFKLIRNNNKNLINEKEFLKIIQNDLEYAHKFLEDGKIIMVYDFVQKTRKKIIDRYRNISSEITPINQVQLNAKIGDS